MKLRVLLTLLIASFCLSSFAQTGSLYFVNGTAQSVSICENSSNYYIDNYLATYDKTTGNLLTYSIKSIPSHGTLHGFPGSGGSNGGVFSPSGFYYTPTTNYNGTDAFTIQVLDGTTTAITKFTVTINALPTVAAITGSTISCGSGTSNLSDATGKGIWSSDNSIVCTIDSLLGTVTPGTAGTATIGYTVTSTTTGCSNTATTTFTVSGAPVVNGIGATGGTTICAGSTTTYTDATPAPTGGTAIWKSSNTAFATIDSITGVITGVAAGNPTISYVVTNMYGCNRTVTRGLTVTAAPVADTIAYTTKNVCVGATITLTNATPGGGGITRAWSSSNGNATISRGLLGISTENVLGTTPGTDSIFFNVTSGGCTVSANVVVTVNPIPVIGAISGVSSVCQFNTVQLTDTTPKGTWTSSKTTVATINSNTGLLSALTAGTTNLTYSVTSAFGCSASVTSPFTVFAAAAVNPIVGTNSICIGSSTTLTDNTVGGAWSISNSKIATIDNGGLLTGKAAGTDTVYYTYTTSGGCTQIASFPITVAASVVVAPILGSSSVCLNSTTQLTDASIDPTATWSSSDQTIAAVDNNGNITTVQPGVVTIQYSIGSGSCIGTALKNFIVYGLPTIDNNSVVAGDTSICSGSSFKISNDSTGGVWSTSSASASVDTSGLVTGVSTGSSVITYSITDKNGCYNAATTTVAVNATPAAFTITGSNSTCAGGVISYTTNLTNSVTATWLSSNPSVATLTNSGKTLSNSLIASKVNTGSTTIYCTASNGQCTRTQSIVVTVTKALVVAPIVGNTNLCMGTSSTFTDSTNSGTITWTVSSGTGAANITNGVVTPVTAGTATVNYSINAGNGCTGSVTKAIVINNLPTVGAISVPNPGTVCAGSTITLSDTTKGGIWKSGNTGAAIIDTASGILTGVTGTRGAGTNVTITYTYTSPVGCISSKTATVTVNTGNPATPNTGVASLCAGSSYTFTNTTAGGTWSSDNTAVATVNSSTGIVTAVASGSAVVQYTTTGFGRCPSVANSNLTVVALPKIVSNTGDSVLCVGQNAQLFNASVIPTGGSYQWSSSNTSIATVSATGLVTAVGSGKVSIYYTVINPKISVSTCYSTATTNFVINANPTVPSISGSGSTLCVGSSLTLSNATIGGTWGVNDTTIATISPSTGIITGVAGGNIIVTYYVSDPITGCNTTVFGNGTIISLPTISDIVGNNVLCMGTPSQLTNATTQGVWSSSNTAVAKVSTTGLVTTLSPGTSVISYTYTNPTYGCKNAATDTVSVNPVPVVGPITGNASVCFGNAISLADTTTGGTWTSTNNAIATVDNNGTVTPVSFGSDSIKYSVSDLVTSCNTTVTLPIKVSSTPVASFTVNKPSQCLSGNYFLFTNTSTISSGSINSIWTIDGKTFTTSNSTYSFAAAGTYTIKLVVTSTSGCVDSTVQTVTVNPQSTASFAINNNSQCLSGNSFSFTNNSTISSGSDGFSWSFGDGTSATSINASHTYTSAGSFVVQLITTSNFGCLDSTAQTITTLANLTPTVSVKATSTNICSGTNVTFTATITNGGTSPTYQWYKNGLPVGTSSNTYSDNALANADNVKCVLTSSYQCLTVPSATSNVLVITVSQYVTPSVSISTPTSTVCSGTNVTFTASSTNGGSSPTYQWTVNGASVGTNSNTYSSSVLTNNSVVALTLTSSTTCVTSRSTNSNDITLIVNSLSSSNTVASICSGNSYSFNGTAYNVSGTYTTYLTNSVGCDSAATLVLTVKSTSTSSTKASICQGSTYTFNGIGYTNAGTYTTHLTNSVGCDSAATLILTIKSLSTSTTKASICNGASFTFNGNSYKTAGTYVSHLTNSVGCDSAATLILTVKSTSTSLTTASICSGASYTFNGVAYTTAGTYVSHLTNSVGCDSAATLELTVKPTSTSTTTASICSGNSYSFNGTSYSLTGSYTTHLTNSVGCDSAATLVLTVKSTSTSTTKASICSGGSYTFNGTVYTSAGTYVSHLTNSVGCDSAASLILTVKSLTTSTTNVSICTGGSYTFNGTVYTSAGTYVSHLTNSVGCDSAATLKLTVKATSTSTTPASICAGTSYTFNGSAYTTAGIYVSHLTNSVGCDSAATLVLTVKATSTSTTTASICAGATYTFNGVGYTKSGTYVSHLTNSVGCDSAATLVLTVKATSTSTIKASICTGGSYSFNGTTYTTSGTYVSHLTNSVGCDSAASLILVVNTPSVSTTNTSICAGTSYTFNGTVYTTAGTYVAHLTNSVGCDSAATLVLTVKSTSTSITKASICSGSSYTFNGTAYTSAGTYVSHLTNSVGCDSAATLILTVKPTSTSTTTQSICAGTSYTFNGTTYTSAGTYVSHLTNSVGCDSAATLVLSIKATSASITKASICAGTSYTFNGTTYTSAGTYVSHLTNSLGCDSAATLVLTVKAISSSITKASICTGSNYLFNGTSYTVSGTYVSHLTNSVGCDSTATLVLTVNTPSASTTTASICSGGSYTFNGLTYTTAGSYVSHLTNSVGCDSVATLVLTVKATSTSTTTASICAGTSYLFNGTTYTSAGSYVSHLTNSVGCDSAATLVLSIKATSTSSTTASICAGATYTFNGVVYTKSGSYVSHLTNSMGCDSAATLILTINATSGSITKASICAGNIYAFNGNTYDSTGSYTVHLTNSLGCDSAATLILTVKYPTTSITKASICAGTNYSFNGNSYDSAGSYLSHLVNAVGCDSTATLVLTVKYPSSSLTTARIDSGSTYLFNGVNYAKAGTYLVHLTNSVGCDSAATLVLSVISPTSSITSVSICAGSSYIFGGKSYNVAGTYTDHYKNAGGADSAAILILVVKPISTSTTNLSICPSALPFVWNGLTFNSAGSQTTHLINSVGCDSAATLILTVKSTSVSTTKASICAGANYTFNGITYDSAGTYVSHLTNSVGCDSAATLVLSVKYPTTSTTTISICAGTSYTFNGTTYTTAGTYVSHLTNAVGCDSAASLILIIKANTTSITTASICAGVSYTFNGTAYTNAGTYVSHLTNSVGCDSAATLVLTVKPTSSSGTTASICFGGSYVFNGVVYTSAGSYTAHLTNAVGCDSAANLILMVKATSTSTTTASICAGTSYTFNGTAYTKAGSYVAHLTNSVGCDSAATLVLNVKAISASTTSASICAGTSYVFNGVSYDSAGTYIAHLTNAVGCDSAASLVLSVKYPSTSITTISVCPSSLPYSWNGVTFTSAGSQTVHLTNAVGCDSAATLVLIVKAISSSTTNITICSSALPYTWNGLTFTGAGTLTAHLTNSVGCDSAATLILTVNPVTTSITRISICPSALPYSWNGLIFTVEGTQVAHLTNSAGCDSAATLVLSVKSNSTSTTSVNICAGTTYTFNGKSYDSTGTYVAHLINAAGCDSTATLILTVKYPTTSSTTATICTGNGYNFNGTVYNTPGTYVAHLINAVGCDSTATLKLSVNSPSNSVTIASVDSGNTYIFNGISYTQAGTYIAHLTNSVGCDSTAKLILTVINPTSSTTKATICAGSSYLYNGNSYDSAGVYVNHFKNAGGADSTATLLLSVNYPTSSITTASICAGASFTFNGTLYDSAGTYKSHLTNSVGCDSIATLILKVKYPSTSIIATSICAGSSYSFNGSSYDSAGTYLAHFTNAVGCDSTVKLILTVHYSTFSTTTASICAGATFTFNGKTYDSTGTYLAHLANSNGCDSVATLVLTVKYPTKSTTSASICAGSSYLFNGNVYDSTGSYTVHLTNSAGCDSAATLILTVKYPTISTTTASICAGTIYNFNNIGYDSAGTYSSHYVNSVGCDSTAVLVLSIKYPSTSTTKASICSGGSYTFNGTTYSTAGSYVAHLSNAVGCDSAATLILSVKATSTSITTASICIGGSYTFNGTTYTAAGSYVAHLTNAVGCDSTATLILTVNAPSTSITTVSICNGGSYTFNGTAYATAGTYVSHLTNAVGCDSAATLVLTIKSTSTSTTTASICSGASYTFNGTAYTVAGTYVTHFTNAVGCDSAASLILTVHTATSSTTYDTINKGGSVTFNGTAYTVAGTYVAHLTNAGGCDSTATLVLTVNDIVPVSLKFFSGIHKSNGTKLSWSTANEINAAYFIIQRSADGKTFTSLDNVAASGNKSGSNYFYLDASSAVGKVYYRLKIVDKQGSFVYSNVVEITLNSGITFSVYPNPVRSMMSLKVINDKVETVSVKVIDLLGKVLNQQQAQLIAGDNNLTINVSSLASGSYIVVIKGQSEESRHFIKY